MDSSHGALWALWAALVFAGSAVLLAIAGAVARRREEENPSPPSARAELGLVVFPVAASVFTFVLTGIAAIALWTALQRHDYTLQYVVMHVGEFVTPRYAFLAFWSGPEGGLLLAALCVTLMMAFTVWRSSRFTRDVAAWITGTGALLAGATVAATLRHSPFAPMTPPPIDGWGMNPALHSVSTALLFPWLILGLSFTVAPFVYAMAAAGTRRDDDALMRPAHVGLLWCWVILTLRIVVGMRVAPMEFASADFSEWESVANGALVVWLTTSATLIALALHRRHRRFCRTAVTLIALSFAAAVFSLCRSLALMTVGDTGATASGSGHWWVFGIGAVVAATVFAMRRRIPDMSVETAAEGLSNSDALLVSGGAVLMFSAFATLAIPVLPVLAMSLRSPALAGSVRYCSAVIGPLSLIMLAIVVLLPVASRRSDAGESWWRPWAAPVATALVALVAIVSIGMRHPFVVLGSTLCGFGIGALAREAVREWQEFRVVHRGGVFATIPPYVVARHARLAGRLAQAGVLLLFAGFAGALLRTAVPVTLPSGESRAVTDPYHGEWIFNSQGLSSFEEPDRRVRAVTVAVVRHGKSRGLLTSEKRDYADSDDNSHYPPFTTIGLLTTWTEDVHFAYSNNETRETVNVVVYFNPLAVCLFAGGLLIAFGGAIAAFPPRIPSEELA